MTSTHGFGPLEMQVLGLFEGRKAASVTDVQARLRDAGQDAAYTTVMTVLSRLYDKGALTRRRDGKRFLYALARGASLRTSSIVEGIHQKLFKTVRTRPIAALLEQNELSTEELQALKKLVDAKLKARKR